MHVNFAPVVDVSNNPLNPITNYRAWSDDPAVVARNSRLYMRGLQEAGILAVAKHFPGHGDVDVDSHLALPTVRVDRGRLDTLELPPYRHLIRAGLGGVMVAHLNVPALDTTGGPSTLARAIVTDVLRQELKFNGLIFTDAMNMGGVISKFAPGEADVRALLAGNDILEFSQNVPLALRLVRAAVDSGRISQREIDAHCRRVLALKQWAGLDHYRPVSSQNIVADLNPPHARYLSHRLSELSITLLRNEKKPAAAAGPRLAAHCHRHHRRGARRHGGVSAGRGRLRAHGPLPPLRRAHARRAGGPAGPPVQLRPYPAGLAGFEPPPGRQLRRQPRGQHAAARAAENRGSGWCWPCFGSAYALTELRDLTRADAVLLAYQESANAQSLTAQVIFGGIGASGELPLTLSDKLPRGFGLRTEGGLRLRYAPPEAVGLDGRLEARVDSIVGQALAAQATPGMQVLIARRGAVVLRKSYGNQTYAGFGEEVRMNEERKGRKRNVSQKRLADALALQPNQRVTTPRPVRDDDVYDLASLTKALAATPALMQLQAAGQFSPDSTLGDYFPDLRKTNKANLKMRDVLAHQAGLQAFIPSGRSW